MAEQEASVKKTVEREITCAVCHAHYTDPKVLPCCHYYCKQCVLDLAQRAGTNKPFPCPECRKDTTLPQGGVDQLQTAFFINRLKSMHSNMERATGKVEATCESCSRGGKAEAFCRQCAMFICTKCVEHHQVLRVFAGHKTVTLEELKEGGGVDILTKPPLQMCKLHQEPLKIYCFDNDCGRLICRDCILKDHQNHNYEFITVAAPEMKKKLIQHLQPLKEADKSLSEAVKEILATKSEIEAQGNAATSHIEKSFGELKKIIECCKQELKEETSRKVSEKLEHLSAQEKSLSTARIRVQSVIDYTEQCVEHLADDEVMCRHTKIQHCIDREVEGLTQDLEPVEEADLTVEVMCAEDLKQFCLTKARINLGYTVTSEGLKSAEINKTSQFHAKVQLPNGKPTKRTRAVACHLKSLVENSRVKCETVCTEGGKYRIEYKPTVRGRHELIVTVNGQQEVFRVFISIPPTQLDKPVCKPWPVKDPRDIAVTSAGKVVIASKTKIMLFEDKRELLSTYDLRGSDEQFMGMTVDNNNGNIIYANINGNEILKLSADLKPVQRCKFNPSTSTYFSGVAVIGEEVMVCDYNAKHVKAYTKELEYVRKIGDGKMSEICGVSSDEQGNVYVTDRSGSRECIYVFSNGGDFVGSFNTDRNGTRVLRSPYGVCVSGEYVYTATVNYGNDKLFVFTTKGKYVTTFGKKGYSEDEIYSCWGMCVDKDGFVYVCDTSNNRIQTF